MGSEHSHSRDWLGTLARYIAGFLSVSRQGQGRQPAVELAEMTDARDGLDFTNGTTPGLTTAAMPSVSAICGPNSDEPGVVAPQHPLQQAQLQQQGGLHQRQTVQLMSEQQRHILQPDLASGHAQGEAGKLAAGLQQHKTLQQSKQCSSVHSRTAHEHKSRLPLPSVCAQAANSSAAEAMASAPIAVLQSATDSTSSGLPAAPLQSTTRRTGTLPASGNEQLDKYLNYLLWEAHPHKFLYYPGWNVSVAGCAAVGEFLRLDKRIKVMTLSGNDITDEGAEFIAEGLLHNGTLMCLDLSSNKIGSMGAFALAEALHSNNTLAELQLSSNRIDDEGAEALAAAAASSTSLKKLHLIGNAISTAQLQMVQQAVRSKEYKLPKQPQASNRGKSHRCKSSSGQAINIELTDGDGLSQSAAKYQLPPAAAAEALSQPVDPLEISLSTQVADLLSQITGAQLEAAASTLADALQPANEALLPASTGSSKGAVDMQLLCWLALRLAGRGYDVILRTCYSSQTDSTHEPAAAPFSTAHGLMHTIILVSQPGLQNSPCSPVIVDPTFKQQFYKIQATDRYRTVVSNLPSVLCLAEARVYHLVEAVWSELAKLQREFGGAASESVAGIMDKWLGSSFLDVAVGSDASTASLLNAVQHQLGPV